jgi:signal transduction histidine kinase
MRRPATPEIHEQRILILAPFRQDAAAAASLVQRGGLQATICKDLDSLIEQLLEGAGALLMAEEAIGPPPQAAKLAAALAEQPPWSELPVLLVGAGNARNGRKPAFERVGGYVNAVLLDRPLRSTTLISALRAALRARRRQYQIRDYLLERARQEQQLHRLNETLEQRVAERTQELENAMRHREEAERALQQAQRAEAIGQITGGVAHDLNNLLMVFLGGLNLLERKPDAAPQRALIIQGMRDAAARAHTLTKQLLAFGRRMALVPEPIQLRELIDGMRTLVGGALREDIAIEIHVESSLWPILADRTQLQLALINLAVNARDAMPKGGTLRIIGRNVANPLLHLSGEFVSIAVQDTGEGIAAAILGRVFDPFFTTKPVGKGTGLGLSQVHGFVSQSGGEARIESEPAKGTTVTLYLPRAKPEHASDVKLAIPAATPIANGDRTVLLVEDNPGVAQIAAGMLDVLGFRVVHAENAQDALRQLERVAVDVVFSDVVMPGGMNGIELAREVKKRKPSLPVLLTSGYSEAFPKLNPSENLQMIEKPYELSALEQALRSLAPAPHPSATQ